MKLKITSFIAAICTVANLSASSFSITSGNGYLEKGTDCFVFEDASKGSITFTTGNHLLDSVVCYKITITEGEKTREVIGNENISLSADLKQVTINNLSANTGYVVLNTNHSQNQAFKDSSYAYVINYQPLTKVSFPDTIACGEDVRLLFEPTIQYYNIYGNPQKLDRDLSLGYYSFGLRGEQPTIDSISYSINAADYYDLDSVPYTDTKFYVTDLTAKNLLKSGNFIVTSDSLFHNTSVVAFPTMETTTKQQHEADDSKEHFMRFSSEHDEAVEAAKSFRHSGPLVLNLESFANDTANSFHYEWAFISGDDAMKGDYNYNAFHNHGNYVNAYKIEDPGLHCVQLTVRNLNDTTCKHQSYACLQITESRIAAPNAFTPNGDGVNDEFRVAYQSIATFEISIYDQWGRRVYQSTDITQGWDGNFHGKLASIGAYFYVIKAVGTDEEEYILKGDVNLIRSKK